jgi:hypothetical protein
VVNDARQFGHELRVVKSHSALATRASPGQNAAQEWKLQVPVVTWNSLGIPRDPKGIRRPPAAMKAGIDLMLSARNVEEMVLGEH